MRSKGEKWILWDNREITIVEDLPNGWIRILNEARLIEVIQESGLKEWLNKKDFIESQED